MLVSFFSGQVLKVSLHPKEQRMHYPMETLLGGLPNMGVRNQIFAIPSYANVIFFNQAIVFSI